MSVHEPPKESRNFLNPCCLWNQEFLDKDAHSQMQNAFFHEGIAKTCWVSYLLFSAFLSVSLSAINTSYLPTALTAIYFLYQPFMEWAYYPSQTFAALAKAKERSSHGISAEIKHLSSLPNKKLKELIESRRGKPINDASGIYLSLLAQYNFLNEDKQVKELEIQELKSEVDNNNSKLLDTPEERKKSLRASLHHQRKFIYEREERLYIQKVELAYLLHLLRNPYDKKKLSEFGNYESVTFSHFCSSQIGDLVTSPPFFKPTEKPSISWNQIKSWTVSELHDAIF